MDVRLKQSQDVEEMAAKGKWYSTMTAMLEKLGGITLKHWNGRVMELDLGNGIVTLCLNSDTQRLEDVMLDATHVGIEAIVKAAVEDNDPRFAIREIKAMLA